LAPLSCSVGCESAVSALRLTGSPSCDGFVLSFSSATCFSDFLPPCDNLSSAMTLNHLSSFHQAVGRVCSHILSNPWRFGSCSSSLRDLKPSPKTRIRQIVLKHQCKGWWFVLTSFPLAFLLGLSCSVGSFELFSAFILTGSPSAEGFFSNFSFAISGRVFLSLSTVSVLII